jgi:MFS family permease
LLQKVLPPLVKRPAFRDLWLGQTISVFGDQVTLLAVPLIAVLTLGATPEQMGLLTAAGLLPHLLFSLPAGVWMDRVRSRRRLMILFDLGRAVVVGSIAVTFVVGALSLPQLFITTFVAGTLGVAFDLGWSTQFVTVVERDEYLTATSMFNGSRSLAQVAGPLIGGTLIQVFSAPLAVVVDAVSYLFSAFFLTRIHTPEPQIEPSTEGLHSQLTIGLSFIARDRVMRTALASVATVNFFSYAFSAVFILYAVNELGLNPGQIGFALGAGAIGAVVGAIVAARVGRRIGVGPAYALGLILLPAGSLLIPLTSPGWPIELIVGLLFASELISGFGVMILDVNAGAIIPSRTPHAIRSRAMGGWRVVNMGIRPIGAVVGGFLGGAIGVRETLFIGAIGAMLGVLFLIGSPVLGLREVPETAEI